MGVKGKASSSFARPALAPCRVGGANSARAYALHPSPRGESSLNRKYGPCFPIKNPGEREIACALPVLGPRRPPVVPFRAVRCL